jgi:hypothetical protein
MDQGRLRRRGTWLSPLSDSLARRPIPHAARGLAAVLARADPAGAVVDGSPRSSCGKGPRETAQRSPLSATTGRLAASYRCPSTDHDRRDMAATGNALQGIVDAGKQRRLWFAAPLSSLGTLD